MIEFVDYNEIYNSDKPKKKNTRRSRRGNKNKPEAAVNVSTASSEEE